MTGDQVEARVRNFLGSDTVEAPINISDLYVLINEAYSEYVARFTSVWITSETVDSATSSFNIGTAVDGQWIDCEGLECWDMVTNDPDTALPVYTPLKHHTEGQVLSSLRGRGAVARPQEYSLSLKSRSLALGRSQFLVRVHPIPDTIYRFRARIRAWPVVEIVDTGDTFQQMDDEQCEQLAAWIAVRIARLLAYPADHVDRLAQWLPPQLQAELGLIGDLAWAHSLPRGVSFVTEAA